ncbi:hypothetical protein KRP22_003342 [Phytophthora ramorum]|nr:hypothetical protein KRP22_6995 [Phytophthora ramorum]
MTKAASRQKANNANANNVSAAAATNAPVKPVNTKATEDNVKATTTVPAAPTRQAPSPGKNAVNNTKPFAVADITVASVQRARQIRKADGQRFEKFLNFFIANDEGAARPISGMANVKREQVDQWVSGAVNPKTLTCIKEIQETQQALVEMIIVSAAITKYGEQELARRDALGEMDIVVGARFGTSGLRSKQQMPHSVGVSFVLRLVLGLAPEKRAACQLLREILSHESNAHLVLTPTSKGLKPVFGAVAADAGDWDQLDQYKLKHMTKQAQSKKFQETMQQLGGGYLYDAIRTQVKQAGGASFWDAAKDKPSLQAKNLRPRSGSADQSKKQQQQAVKKDGGQAQKPTPVEKKHLPAEVKVSVAVVPPPAPVVVKAAATAEKNIAPKKQKEKNVAPVKNATPVKNASPVKNVSAGTIVTNAPAGRAKISKAK